MATGNLTALYLMHAISFVTYKLGKSSTILNDRFQNVSIVTDLLTGKKSDWSHARDTWSCMNNSYS
jgi:hypothetical protein